MIVDRAKRELGLVMSLFFYFICVKTLIDWVRLRIKAFALKAWGFRALPAVPFCSGVRSGLRDGMGTSGKRGVQQ